MRIERARAVAGDSKAEQVAKILGVPPETVQVITGPDGVEVSLGKLEKGGF